MHGRMSDTPPRSVLERAILVIEAVVDHAGPVGPRALARVTGIDRSAVGRILLQLSDLGVLERGDDGYTPGPRVFDLARVLGALDTLPAAAHAVLAGLVEEFDETCYLCVLHGDAAVFLYQEQSSKPLRYVADLGRPVPLHAGAAGRAILSGMTRSEAAALLSSVPLVELTPNTITDLERLLDLAESDGRRGWSVSEEERVEGGVAVAAPFFDRSGRVQGSVVFTSPIGRFGDSDVIGKAVNDAASTLSARLGHRP